MLLHRESSQRGHADHGWLKSSHSFSFADFYDPKHMHFRHLRVVNEDRVAPGAGFPTHPHRDMEIITYVIDGAIEHKDSMGNGSVIHAGEIQRMTAGTGLSHSEYNHYADRPLHFLQIWIIPDEKNLPPSYEQKSYTDQLNTNELHLIASASGGSSAVKVHQDIKIYTARSSANQPMDYQIEADRHVWIQVIRGAMLVNDQALQDGDGLAVSHEKQLLFNTSKATEFLLFDLQ